METGVDIEGRLYRTGISLGGGLKRWTVKQSHRHGLLHQSAECRELNLKAI